MNCETCKAEIKNGDIVNFCVHPDDPGHEDIVYMMYWHVQCDAPERATEPVREFRVSGLDEDTVAL